MHIGTTSITTRMTAAAISAVMVVVIASIVALSSPGGAAEPRVCGGLRPTIVAGSPGVVRGTAGDDVIVGSSGDDVLRGLGGDDVICGGNGDDIVHGGSGHDRLRGGDGADRVHGGPGRDHLDGGDGGDDLFGDGRRDALDGAAGPDHCRGGRGEDRARSCERDRPLPRPTPVTDDSPSPIRPTPTPTPTVAPVPPPTATPTSVPTATPTPTPTPTATASPTPTARPTASATSTPAPPPPPTTTIVPTPTPTATPVVVPTTPPAGGAMVSFTFDDGRRSNYTVAAPLLEGHGMRGTFYLTSSYLDGSLSMTRQNVVDLDRRGHEIGAHTIDHPDLRTLDTAEVDRQLRVPRQELEALIGGPVTSFATPYGAYDARVLERIRLAYSSHRNVETGLNRRGAIDPHQLTVRNILSGTTTAEVDSWLATAAAEGAWLILVYHDVVDTPTAYDTTPAALDRHLAAAQARGIRSVTVSEGLAAYGAG